MSKFKILWIDDQEKKCKRDVAEVKKFIESQGFEPEIRVETNISISSLSQPDGVLYQEIRARDVDLYLVDYNLKNNVFGSDIVRQIRSDNNIYTDIVFYSSDSLSLITEIKKSYDAESILDYCDGVYVVPLGDEFIFKVEQIITKTIKSWYNVHSIRGIILSKVSKFEQLVSEIINTYYMDYLDAIKCDLDQKGENVCKSITSQWSLVRTASDPIPQILRDPIHFSWATKRKILERLHNSNAIQLSTWIDIDDIFRLRNDFAHNPIHLRNGELVLTTIRGEVRYTESDVDRIRSILTRIEADLTKFVPSTDDSKVLPDIISEDDVIEKTGEEIIDSTKKELAPV